MIQLHVLVAPHLSETLESWFCELDEPGPWMLRDDKVLNKLELFGYFETEETAQTHYRALRGAFPELPDVGVLTALEDRDWKEAYKDHFKPWSSGSLHWVPAWERDTYHLPALDRAIYLDPGMAFGTGNHETTRLCAVRLVSLVEQWKGTLEQRTVIDAGCGSGILAISAVALGFGHVSGFDIDPDSVEIARENAQENGVEGKVEFSTSGLDEGLAGKQADLVMANILANVLLDNSKLLLSSVKSGGVLVLSGILCKEMPALRESFEQQARGLWGQYEAESRTDGEWADLLLKR